ncbi:PrgI family protein [Candidatus Azambacteria bacterium]|nr:PrgI family protein [Candidatus Azambacteria bacterium]MBI3685326.1 PrgI family protein [Candidatus Azambacteria bacterium]
MKQFQVPQFIDVEDRILGPITMRQFFIMLIPFGTGILLYFLFKFWVVIIVTIPVIIGSAVFAFYRPYGMKFSRFFSSFLSYMMKPHMYLWKREEQARVVFENPAEASPHQEKEKIMGKSSLKTKKSSVETGSVYHEN